VKTALRHGIVTVKESQLVYECSLGMLQDLMAVNLRVGKWVLVNPGSGNKAAQANGALSESGTELEHVQKLVRKRGHRARCLLFPDETALVDSSWARPGQPIFRVSQEVPDSFQDSSEEGFHITGRFRWREIVCQRDSDSSCVPLPHV
jgi:hypothetical protein